MTDKQREAIQALADVMEKYGVAIGTALDPVWLDIRTSFHIYAEDGIVNAEFLKGVLRDDD